MPPPQFGFTDLPRELIEEVVKYMDTLSKIRLAATCTTMNKFVDPGFVNQVCLNEFGDTHRFLNMQEFVEHVLVTVSNGMLDEKKYFMVRFENCSIVFCRIRRGKKNSYRVRIENDNATVMQMSYDGKRRTIACDKITMDVIEIPQMLFVLGMRFLMHVYKYRKMKYNFDVNFIPEHIQKIFNRTYNGRLLKEVILENFFIC